MSTPSEALRRLAALLAVGAVAWVVSASLAGAQSGGSERSHPPFDDEESQAALAREAERAREREEQRGTPAERERRVEAAVAYRHMGEAEALALARNEFPQTITSPVWEPLRLRAGEEVEAFLGDFAARVRQPGDRLALVESTLPLRSTVGSGQPERVDLGLARVDGQWRPANPLLRVEIAPESERAVSFPGLGFGVGLEPSDNVAPDDGPGESSALVEDRVFYANAAGLRDTDALVTPTPAGAELGLEIRSAESPETFALGFDLASGQRLRAATDGSGAAEVVELDGAAEERPVARIAPPRAVDADGFAVPASYEVDGERLTLTVSHRRAEVLHPVFVESSVGSFYPGGASNETAHVDNLADWSYHTNASDRLASSDPGASANGLYIAAQPADYSPGDYGEWLWSAPRRSFIERVDFDASHAAVSSCVVEGIWDGDTPGAWDRGSWRSATDAAGVSPWYTGASTGEENVDACASLDWDYKAHCVGDHDPATDTFASCVPGSPAGDPTGDRANSAVFGMVMTGPVADRYRADASLPAATRWLYDRDVPEISELTHSGLPSGWTDSAAITTQVRASEPDPGLGVKRLELELPSGTQTRTHPCTGARGSRCPTSWALPDAATDTPAFTYDTDDMPEGANTVRVIAYDALDKSGERASVAEWAVKVDRSAPELALGGELWELEGRDVGPGSYSLDVDASDRHSGVKSVEIFVDGASVFSESREACADGGCGLSRTWAFDTAEFGRGDHTVKVIATDHAGHERLRDFTVALDDASPALEVERSNPSNDRWVASYSDTLTVAAEDGGTGVAELEVRAGDAAPMVFTDSCQAADPNRCPRALEHDFTLDLPKGVTDVRVVARDGAGNESAPETFTVKVDTEDPKLENLDTSGLGVAGELQGKARLTFSASDTGSGLSGATLLVDGSKASTVRLACETPECTRASGEALLRSDELAQGEHRVSVEVEDRAGRSARSRAVDVDVDGAPVNVEPPAIRGRAHVGETLRADDGEWIASGTPRVSRQWQRCDWSGETCADIAGETGASYTVGEQDLGKRLRVEVEKENAYGSARAASEQRYVPAQPGPEVTIDTHSPGTLQSWVGTRTVATVTAIDRSLETGSGVDSVSLALDGAPVATATACGAAVACPEEMDFPLALSALEEGTHTLEATATGTDGRSSSVESLVTLDASAPQIALGGPLAAAAGQPVAPGTYELEVATGDDGGWVAQSGVASVEVLVDEVPVAHHEQECELGNCRADRTFAVDTSTLGPGPHTVEVVSSDSVGNRSSATLDVLNTAEEDEAGEGQAAPPAEDPGSRDGVAAEERRREHRATPEARAERDRSRTKYAGAGEAEALAVAQEQFADVVEAEIDPLDDEKIVSFLDDFTARVDQGPGEPDALVASLTPLRTEPGSGDTGRVDLDLVDAGPDALKPRNALAEARLPRAADGSVSVGSGVTVRLKGARRGSSAQTTHGKLFYGDAIEGADSDLLLIPQPGGLELLLQVRAAASPERYELVFDLPAGARLEASERGFVRVVRGDDALATVAPPAAWDADGETVPVSYDIKGKTLVVDVDHHERDLLYPLLVDPIIVGANAWSEGFDWSNAPTTDYNGWLWQKDGTFGFAKSGSNGAGAYQWSGGQANNTLNYAANKWSQYSFSAPGAGTPVGTDAYVNKAWFYIRHNSPAGQYTCVKTGIRVGLPNASSADGTWDLGRWYREGLSPGDSPWEVCQTDVDSRWHCLPRPSCELQPGVPTTAGTTGNAAAVHFRMQGSGPRNGSAYVYLGGAQIWLGDRSPPTVTAFTNPKAGQWVSAGETVTTTIKGTDRGLGIRTYEVHMPGPNAFNDHDCPGGRSYPCPALWRDGSDDGDGDFSNKYGTANVPYTVDPDWAEGPISISASAKDVVIQSSEATDVDKWRTWIYVDNTPPDIEFSGTLYDRRNLVVADGVYDLHVHAPDGDPSSSATMRSGTEQLELWLDDELQDEVAEECATHSCALDLDWSIDTSTLEGGSHTVKAVATDKLGHVRTESFVFTKVCCLASESGFPWTVGSPEFGDVTGDGRDDAVGRDVLGRFMVGRSNAAGFDAASDWGQGPPVGEFSIADTNADGFEDALWRDAVTGNLHVALSDGSQFALSQVWGSVATDLAVKFTDVDIDQRADAVLYDPITGTVSARYSDGTEFEPAFEWTTWDPSYSVDYVDVTGDGAADAVGRNPAGDIQVGVSTAGSFEAPTSWASWTVDDLFFADVDGDGLGDAVGRNRATDAVEYRSSNGYAFEGARPLGQWSLADFRPADVSGDERHDLVGFDELTGQITTARSNAPTPLGPPPDVSSPANPIEILDEAPDPIDPLEGSVAGTGFRNPPVGSPRLAASDDGLLRERQPKRLTPGWEERQIDQFYRRLRETGVTVMRFWAFWGGIENVPGSAERYDWHQLDDAVAEARSWKMRVHLTITGTVSDKLQECGFTGNPNGIGCKGGVQTPTGISPDPAHFGEFVQKVVEHYGDPTVPERFAASYGIWNEPNQPGWLDDGNDDTVLPVALYRDLYQEAYDGWVASGHAPDTRIQIGELASAAQSDPQVGPHCPTFSSDRAKCIWTAMDFLSRVVNGSPEPLITSGLAYHPYQHRTPPNQQPARYKNPETRELVRGASGELGISRLGAVERKVSDLCDPQNGQCAGKLQATNAQRRPAIYLTEFGYLNLPRDGDRRRKWHTERERRNWLYGTDVDGALDLADESEARWMLLYQVAEARPPVEATSPDDEFDEDYGLFALAEPTSNGSALDLGPDIFGMRPYGKSESNERINNPQQRRAYCAIRRWAIEKRYFDPTTPDPRLSQDDYLGDDRKNACPRPPDGRDNAEHERAKQDA